MRIMVFFLMIWFVWCVGLLLQISGCNPSTQQTTGDGGDTDSDPQPDDLAISPFDPTATSWQAIRLSELIDAHRTVTCLKMLECKTNLTEVMLSRAGREIDDSNKINELCFISLSLSYG